MKLYECSSEVIRVLDDLGDEAENGEQWAVDTIESVIGDFESKAADILAYTKNLSFEIDAISAFLKEVATKKRVLENKQNRLKEYVALQMTRCGLEKIDTPFLKASFRASKAVEIENIELLPESVLKIVKEPNKTEIKKRIEAGEAIDGAKIVERKSLQIR